jgi:C1A family cysteine protease
MEQIYKVGGWQPDPSNRVYASFNPNSFSLTKESKNIDLRPFSISRHNQRNTSTCVANAATKALEIKRVMKHGINSHVDLSRLDLYYGCRERMNPPRNDKDDGTHIYLACEILRDFGICREQMHPFTKENIFKKPSIMASREGRLNRIKSCFKIDSIGDKRLEDIVFNLQAGNPVIFGTLVGKTWMNYKGDGAIGIENEGGGHAMCCIGYVGGSFIIENSWSEYWGINGFCFVKPEVMASNNTRDLWVIVDGSECWMEK